MRLRISRIVPCAIAPLAFTIASHATPASQQSSIPDPSSIPLHRPTLRGSARRRSSQSRPVRALGSLSDYRLRGVPKGLWMVLEPGMESVSSDPGRSGHVDRRTIGSPVRGVRSGARRHSGPRVGTRSPDKPERVTSRNRFPQGANAGERTAGE